MGEGLEGSVHFKGNQLSQTCSIGVGLVLQVEGHDWRTADEDGSGGDWVSLCRSSMIMASHLPLKPGSLHALNYSIIAPGHHPHEYKHSVFGFGDKLFTDYKKLAMMDAETLLRKQSLQWVLTVELSGVDGPVLQKQKILRVRGNLGYRNWSCGGGP